MGIISIKTERTQIHLLSEVLIAVASLDLNRRKTRFNMQLLMHNALSLRWPHKSTNVEDKSKGGGINVNRFVHN